MSSETRGDRKKTSPTQGGTESAKEPCQIGMEPHQNQPRTQVKPRKAQGVELAKNPSKSSEGARRRVSQGAQQYPPWTSSKAGFAQGAESARDPSKISQGPQQKQGTRKAQSQPRTPPKLASDSSKSKGGAKCRVSQGPQENQPGTPAKARKAQGAESAWQRRGTFCPPA